MKAVNCVKGQRVIIKENTSGVPTGTNGVILEDSGLPYVKLFNYEIKPSLPYNWCSKLVGGFLFENVVLLSSTELKKDKEHTSLESIQQYIV